MAKERHSKETHLFLQTETSLVKSGKSSTSIASAITSRPETSTGVGSAISNMINGKDKELPSFWVPSMTPQSSKSKLKKPESTVYCPMSGRPLKANQLIEVHFTPADKSKGKYMCAVTHDLLSNSVSCAVLRTS